MASLKLTYSGLLSSLTGTTKSKFDGKQAYIGSKGLATTASKDNRGTLSYTDDVLKVNLNANEAAFTITTGDTKSGTWNVVGSSKATEFTIKDSVNGGSVTGGLGNDTFIIKSSEKLVLNGGAGNDTFKVDKAFSGHVSLFGGAGKDVFDLRSLASEAHVSFVAGGYKPDEDIILASGTSTTGYDTLSPETAKSLISSDGKLTVANGVTVDLEPYNSTDYYKVKLNGTTFYAGSTTGTTVNGSAESTPIVVIGNNNEEADVLRGGTGNDTLFAGVGDSVLGGRGNDSLDVAQNSGVSVGFSETAKAGSDSVGGVKFNTSLTSFDEDATSFHLGNGNLGRQFKGVSFGTTAVTLKGQDGTMAIQTGSELTAMNVTMSDAGGRYNTVFFKDTLDSVAEKNADIYYSANSKGTLDFTGVTTDVVVDLTNSKSFGDEATYYNVSNVKAGNAASVLMVGGSGSTTLTSGGGQSSLWGGSAANDSLVGGTGRDFFGLSNKGGKDTVQNFTTGKDAYSDVVYLIGTGLADVKKTSSNAMTFTATDGSSLVMKDVVGGSDDDVIAYTSNGADIAYGKVGKSGSKTTFTYDSSVSAYVGGKEGSTLNVYNATDTTVWLDGNAGVGYKNIGVVDASAVSGNALLGGTSANETLMGGLGASTIWGAGGNDSLVGGTGTNTFVVGAGEGTSVITNGKNGDSVMLYNVASTGISASTLKNGNLTVSFRNGGSFTVNDYLNGPRTFTTTDGEYTVNDDGSIDFTKNA